MQTQGVSLAATMLTGMTSSKSTQANDTTFDKFMNVNASKVNVNSPKAEQKQVSTQDKAITEDKKVYANTQSNGQKVIVNAQKNNANEVSNIDTEAMAEKTVQVLSKVFGMSEDDIVDVLEQLGINPEQLLFQIQQDGVVTPINTEMIQNVVMEVHGIEDKIPLLTNDKLTTEVSDITKELSNVLAEEFDIPSTQLDKISEEVMVSFAEAVQNVGDAQVAQVEDRVVVANDNMIQKSDDTLQDIDNDSKIIVEDYTNKNDTVVKNDSDNNSNNDNSNESTDSSNITNTTEEDSLPSTHNESMLDTFSQKLSENFKSDNVENVNEVRQTMTQIVEQVVNQIKIRVLPETTKMELQLNPATLGRVNLQVQTTNGVATAKLTVESEIAKEALETQMISLKESFEEQGLKVEEVEVTVSDFGLNQERDQTGEEQDAQKNKNKRFVLDEEDEDESTVDSQTEAARRDVNSVVDYTA